MIKAARSAGDGYKVLSLIDASLDEFLDNFGTSLILDNGSDDGEFSEEMISDFLVLICINVGG